MIGKGFIEGRPIREPRDDRFGRWPFARLIASIVRDPNNSGLVVLGIEGAWGSGKTSALQMAAAELLRDGRNREVAVSAWRTASQDQFLANLSYAISTAIRRDWQSAAWRIALAKLRRQSLPLQVALFTPLFYLLALMLLPEVRGWSRTVADNPKAWIEGVGLFGLPVLGYLLSKLAQPTIGGLRAMLGGTRIEAIGAVERLAYEFDVLAAAQPPGTRFIVLVEDLDRCTPAHTIDVLSAIGQLETHPRADRIAFLLAYEREKVIDSIAASLAQDAPESARAPAQNYLEKIVHLELPLPDLRPGPSVRGQRRVPSTPVILRGALVSLAIVSLLVARLADPAARRLAGFAVVGIVALFVLEVIVRRWLRPPASAFEPEGWDKAEADAEPWLATLTLRERQRVLSRARAALMIEPGALDAWEAVSIAALASRWPERFNRPELKEMIGTREVQIDRDFQLQDVTDAIRAMEAGGLETAHFRNPAKLYALVSTIQR